MSAQPANIYPLHVESLQEYSTSPQTKKRGSVKKSPRRIEATSTYCFAVTDDLLRDLLHHAATLKNATGEPYSFQAACASVMLDDDKGEARAQVDYQRLWGWSRRQFRDRWEEVIETISNWKTMFGRVQNRQKNGGQIGANEGPMKGHECGDSEEISQSKGQRRANEGPNWGQHTITATSPSLQQEEKERETAREVLPAGVELVEGCPRLTPIAYDGEGKPVHSSEAIAYVTRRAYDIPDGYERPLRAWIETHANIIPRQHDVRALMRLVDTAGEVAVTRAIRKMGNEGYLKFSRLETAVREGGTHG